MQAGEQHRPQRANGRGRLVTKPYRAETRLDGLFQEGCAKIRLPQSFDGRMEAVLINTAGGLTGGDRLAWDFETGAATHLTVTTQACERVYRAVAGTAEVTTRLIVGDGARADWLPQETILFDRSSLTRRLDVDLAPMPSSSRSRQSFSAGRPWVSRWKRVSSATAGASAVPGG